MMERDQYYVEDLDSSNIGANPGGGGALKTPAHLGIQELCIAVFFDFETRVRPMRMEQCLSIGMLRSLTQ